MPYLFAAYTIFFIMITGYIFVLGSRQKSITKDIRYLQDMQKKILAEADNLPKSS